LIKGSARAGNGVSVEFHAVTP